LTIVREEVRAHFSPPDHRPSRRVRGQLSAWRSTWELANRGSIERRTIAKALRSPGRPDQGLCRANGALAGDLCGTHLDRGEGTRLAPLFPVRLHSLGRPHSVDGFAADGRWFGALPQTIVSVDGEKAQQLIPKVRSVVENYKFRAYGDYSPWPGPNSNTFTQAVLDAVPELRSVLPPTAIGKDYPYRGEWIGLTPSRTGAFISLGGYLGLTIGWIEGFEFNFFGGVLGLDIRRPALKLPGIGRLGMSL
jgi:uncharacterized protein DUF3750